MGIYVGIKENPKPEVFMSDMEPTKETDPEYDIIYGPFKTVEEAQGYIKAMEAYPVAAANLKFGENRGEVT